MQKRLARLLFVALVFLLAHSCTPRADGAAVDEIDKLLETAKPPARFKEHRADFSAKEREFTFTTDKGPVSAKLWVIKDKDRYVAIFHGEASKLYVIASDPSRAPDKLELPSSYNTGGNTFDGKLGTRITTFPYAFGFIQMADIRSTKFAGGGKSLTLIDRSAWAKEHKSEAVYAVTFRCNPILGYVVEMDCRFSSDMAKDEEGRPFTPELVNLYPNHTFMRKMPDAAWRYE